jgi:hypothetical protein
MDGNGVPKPLRGGLGLSLPLSTLNTCADAEVEGALGNFASFLLSIFASFLFFIYCPRSLFASFRLETTRYRRTESQLKSQKLNAHKGVCSVITP